MHNAIVCTLCSCYPWPVLGLPPNWYKEPAYRARMVREPRKVLREDFGLDVPDSVEIRVWDSSSEMRYWVLPQRPGRHRGRSTPNALAAARHARLDDRRSGTAGTAPRRRRRATRTRRHRAGRRPAPASEAAGLRRCRRAESSATQRTFDEPWELRAFAMAVAAYHEGQYEWSEFQLSLIDSIKQWEDGAGGEPWNYYEHWLNALETVLAANGALSDAALDDRTREVLATPRNANHHEAHREPVAVSPATT